MEKGKWNLYLNKLVRLIVEDGQYPRPKDGILVEIDDTHVWLIISGKKLPMPFLRSTIRRMELKEIEEVYGTKN